LEHAQHPEINTVNINRQTIGTNIFILYISDHTPFLPQFKRYNEMNN